ncbi:MAG: TIGR01777 family oxidoreductase [Methylovulum miyakonense]|uniref:TIGR01777 family oxidoreductase n=1 Tax=Methylovulum miyakonense TaxID=645578 RepID=UPI003BB5AF9C
MKILITGGTGFIGSMLARSLYDQNYDITVLSRNPEKVSQIGRSGIHALGDLKQLKPNQNYQAIINLAGAPIFDSRWTEARKQLIRNSRIALTEELVNWIGRMEVKPELLISGSAIGYYGNQGDTELTEDSAVRTDFPQQLCQDWEQAAAQAGQFGVRVCLIRTGLVIAQGGGLLQRMLLPFRLGLGGRLGDGQQWMSWIHRQDWITIAQTMIRDTTMRGAYNATAPNPVTNSEFTQTLAACLHRPALLPLPASLLKMLLGEMSGLVLGSQRVLPKRLLDKGFSFGYPDLASALQQSLSHG